MSLGDYDVIFPSHSEDHGSGNRDWEIYLEWKKFIGRKNLPEKIFGKMKILENENFGIFAMTRTRFNS